MNHLAPAYVPPESAGFRASRRYAFDDDPTLVLGVHWTKNALRRSRAGVSDDRAYMPKSLAQPRAWPAHSRELLAAVAPLAALAGPSSPLALACAIPARCASFVASACACAVAAMNAMSASRNGALMALRNSERPWVVPPLQLVCQSLTIPSAPSPGRGLIVRAIHSLLWGDHMTALALSQAAKGYRAKHDHHHSGHKGEMALREPQGRWELRSTQSPRRHRRGACDP